MAHKDPGFERKKAFGGGLLVSQLLTLYITPVLYVYLERLRAPGRSYEARPAPAPEPATALKQ